MRKVFFEPGIGNTMKHPLRRTRVLLMLWSTVDRGLSTVVPDVQECDATKDQ